MLLCGGDTICVLFIVIIVIVVGIVDNFDIIVIIMAITFCWIVIRITPWIQSIGEIISILFLSRYKAINTAAGSIVNIIPSRRVTVYITITTAII